MVMGEPSNAGGDADWDDLDGLNVAPPGEEGIFMNNAGVEDTIFQEIIDFAIPKKYFLLYMQC
jgi:hypothetical protein